MSFIDIIMCSFSSTMSSFHALASLILIILSSKSALCLDSSRQDSNYASFISFFF
jgi:hypothetical protein